MERGENSREGKGKKEERKRGGERIKREERRREGEEKERRESTSESVIKI